MANSKHNIMVQATPLKDVVGRVDYISSHDRQENLVATYSSNSDEMFWRKLQIHCNRQAKEARHKHGCGGREFMAALANELSAMDPNELAKTISSSMKELTGTDNTVALHWNKAHTNFHCHIIVAENKEINEVSYGAVLTRNTYYDANGHRSSKKDCIDPNTKELLPGCQFVKKGDRKATVKRFGAKNEDISSKSFLMAVKHNLAKLQNNLLEEDRFTRKKSELYLAEQHIGKNKTAKQIIAIKEKNELVRDWNSTIDQILDISDEELIEDAKIARENLKDARRIDLKAWIEELKVSLGELKVILQEWLREHFRGQSEHDGHKSLDNLINNAKNKSKNNNIISKNKQKEPER